MNFISERIEGEGDLEYFDSFGFKDNLGKEFKPFWWAIDRESDIFLFFCEGEASDKLLKCGLCINKELVEIQMQNKTEKKEEKSGLFVHWIINKIVIPVSLIERGYVEDDIVYIIENALIAIGLPGVSEKEVAETTVEIKTRPMIVKNKNVNVEYEHGIEESYKKEKKDDPFGCGLVIAIVLAYIIAQIITIQDDLEYSDGVILRKTAVAVLASAYGVLYYIIKYIRKKFKK